MGVCTYFWKKWSIVELLLLIRFVYVRFGVGSGDTFSFQIASGHTFSQVCHHDCLLAVESHDFVAKKYDDKDEKKR